jgi:hypothetical protein
MGKWNGISGICNQPFIHFIFGFARKWDIFADARAARDPQVQRTWYCIFGHIYKKVVTAINFENDEMGCSLLDFQALDL